jgi:hypothetical protein
MIGHDHMSLTALSSTLGASPSELMELANRYRLSFYSFSGSIYVPRTALPAWIAAYAQSREG